MSIEAHTIPPSKFPSSFDGLHDVYKNLLNSNKYKKKTHVKAGQIWWEFSVETLEGTMKGKVGDYLMCGVEGELYVCDREIFEKTYERA